MWLCVGTIHLLNPRQRHQQWKNCFLVGIRQTSQASKGLFSRVLGKSLNYLNCTVVTIVNSFKYSFGILKDQNKRSLDHIANTNVLFRYQLFLIVYVAGKK